MANTLTPPYLFGGSFDALAGQRLAYDNANIGLAQSDLAARQRAQDIARRNAEYEQSQLDAEAARQDAATERGNANAWQQYQFAAQQAANARNEDRLAKAEADRYSFNRSLNDATIRQQAEAGDYGEVLKAIDAGKIDDPALIGSLFPNLTPLERRKAETYLGSNQQKATEDYGQIESAAYAATARLKDLKTPKTGGGKTWFGLGANAPVARGPTPQINEEEALRELAGMPQFKQAAPLLRWDEAQQMFVPVTRMPRGYQSPKSLAMVAAPFAAPTDATPVANDFAFSASPEWQAQPAAAPYAFSPNATPVLQLPPPVTVSTNNRAPVNRKFTWQPGIGLAPAQ